jgi:hypothetical protein
MTKRTKKLSSSGRWDASNPLQMEKDRKYLQMGGLTSARDELDASRQKAISKARGKAEGFSQGFGGKDKVQEAFKGKKLTAKELSKYDPRALTATQNLRALGHEFKPGKSWRPDKVVKKGWKNLGEGGGGYAAGPAYGKYIPAGAKTMTGMFALGDAKDAVNRSDPTLEGRSRTERAGYAIGGALGGTAGALGAKSIGRLGAASMPVNLALSLGGMMAGYYAGGKAGKGVDYAASKARGVEAGDYTRTQRARIKKKLRSL